MKELMIDAVDYGVVQSARSGDNGRPQTMQRLRRGLHRVDLAIVP